MGAWSFPLQGIRPLVGAAGTFMAWYGNTIHWGSACHSTAQKPPRASLAFVFRRADAPEDPKYPSVTKEELLGIGPSVADRMRMISQAILWFNNWHGLSPEVESTLKRMMHAS